LKNKKFKILKALTKRIIYRWAFQCPKCKTIWRCDFEDCLWAFDSGGLCVSCKVCRLDQVFTKADLEKAITITNEEYDNLFTKKV
jgi:hypothetical protein